jgi:hypothetical protein
MTKASIEAIVNPWDKIINSPIENEFENQISPMKTTFSKIKILNNNKIAENFS